MIIIIIINRANQTHAQVRLLATTCISPKIAQNMPKVSKIKAYYCLIVPIARLLLRWSQFNFVPRKLLSFCMVVVHPSATTLGMEQCALFITQHAKDD